MNKTPDFHWLDAVVLCGLFLFGFGVWYQMTGDLNYSIGIGLIGVAAACFTGIIYNLRNRH